MPEDTPGRRGAGRSSPYSRLPPYNIKEVVYMAAMDILQIIGSYGFPIAMCLLVYFDNRKLEQEMRTLINSNTSAMVELTAAVNQLRGEQK